MADGVSSERRGGPESPRKANDMDGDAGQRSRRGVLKHRRAVLAVVGVLLVLVGLLLVLRRGSVERRLKALRATGYPTSFAELAAYKQLPEGVENAAEVYLEAFANFAPPVDEADVPILGTAELPSRGAALPEPMAQAVSTYLARNAECLALLREASGVAQCRYHWDFQAYAAGLPALGDLKSCTRLLGLAAISYADKGEAAAALAYVEDGLQLSNSLADEPGLLSHLVRVACYGMTLGHLGQVLSVGGFTDEQLRDLGGRLAGIADTLDLTEVMVTERAFMIEWCKDPSLLTGLGGTGRLLKAPGIRRVGLHDCLDYMADCVEASKLPLRRRPARFTEIEKQVEELSFMHVMIEVVRPAMDRVVVLDLRFRAHLDLARAALAIERYRLARGTVPGELDELVPEYLQEVPLDPFDGQPIRYRRTESGYMLYTVLEDGQDNGGLGRGDVNRGEPHDWPFTVTR